MKELEILKHISYQDLQKLYNHAPTAALAKKYLAILQIYIGKSVPDAAWHVRASNAIVRKWVHAWNEFGPEGLKPKPRPRRAAKLTQEQRERFIAVVLGSPKEVGIECSEWTLKTMAGFIQKEYGIEMSLSGISRMLRREELSRKVPRPMPRKADKKKTRI